MDLTLHQQISDFKIASSMMFCFPTGLMNIWSPSIEQIILPEEYAPTTQVEVRVNSKTVEAKNLSCKQKIYQAATGILRNRKTLDYSEKFIFDARWDTYKNIAHILDNIAPPVLFARNLLREYFQKEIDIHIILDSRASENYLAKEVYRLLDLPIICTDNDVFGEVVNISACELFSIRSQLFDLNFPDYSQSNFERIFIPRRGNRSLINNDEVSSFLSEQGFKICYFEDLSIAEQWSIARDAKVVVAVHGAAVSNLIFNRLGLEENAAPGSGVKVVEIMSPGWIHAGFRELVNAINGRWCSVRGQITPDLLSTIDFSTRAPNSLVSPFKDPFKVDCQTIQMALDYLDEDR